MARETVDGHDQANDMATRMATQDAMQCVLHMENRVGEKPFHTLTSTAIDRCPDGNGKTRRTLVKQATECVRSTVLGDEELVGTHSGFSL